MVIDDERDIVSVLTRGLTLKGLEVHGFTDPAEALEHFKPGSFDFVITDIRMPTINGFQLYRKLREKDERIRVFFLTAFDIYEKEAKTMFPSLDPKCFIKKPIRYEDLARILIEDHSRNQELSNRQ
jgi:DNA-binding NtrC family response regulator